MVVGAAHQRTVPESMEYGMPCDGSRQPGERLPRAGTHSDDTSHFSGMDGSLESRAQHIVHQVLLLNTTVHTEDFILHATHMVKIMLKALENKSTFTSVSFIVVSHPILKSLCHGALKNSPPPMQRFAMWENPTPTANAGERNGFRCPI